VRPGIDSLDRTGYAVAGLASGFALARPLRWGEGMHGNVEGTETAFALPAGTVTFLMSDIEGSTRLWEAHPEAMTRAVPTHYALLTESVARHGGVRPVEQGEGDSIVAAFSRASDAVSAALDAQRALSAQAWPDGVQVRVRLALHTAEAQLLDEGNYFGAALNRCARLRAIGNGGQTLLTRGVHDLVVDRLPSGAELVDLGSHRLRDLGRPEHVFALRHPDLPASDEPLRSLDALPNNLPEHLTSFVGREHELTELAQALRATRMLTLTGAGGCGKTRLAAQLAADALDRFPDGVWWIDLAPLGDPDAVGPALGDAIGVKPLPGQTSLEAAVAHLANACVLVVLDNCEHLLEVCAQTAEALLRGAHAVTVVATSRAPLGVGGETTWRVPSLSLPSELAAEPVDAVAQSDAVRLFIERALKVRPNFAVNASNAPAIAQICHDLDGIPLAIELAAARARVLGVEQIAAALGDRFRLLTGGARSAMPRQQTLRASVDWSHELLGEDERVLFRRLAIFAGGWTLDAVEDVCSGEGIEPMAILDLLTLLVDKSLVVVEEQPAGVRYRLLETVRQYGFDRLADAGELADLRDRHRRHYLLRAEQIAPYLEAAGQSVWLDALDNDAANLAAALDHAANSDEESALRLCVALTVWWKLRGRFALADAAYVRALDPASEELAALRARVLWARGYLLAYAGRFEEAVAVELEALEIAQRLAETSTAARALDVLGTIRMFPDPTGAREGLEQARELARSSGDDWCFVDVCQILASTLLMRGDPRAEDVFNDGLEIIEHTGYAEFAAWHWWGIGNVRQIQGRDDEALALYGRAIAVADAVGEPVSSGITHASAGILRSDRGDAERALADLGLATERSVATGAGLALPLLALSTGYCTASAGMLEEGRAALGQYLRQFANGDLYGTALGLCALGRAELALGELGDAFDHAGGALEIADGSLANPAHGAAARCVLAGVALGRGDPTEAERLAHEALSMLIERELAPGVPTLLDTLAQAAAALDSNAEAARILGAADRAYEGLGHARWPQEQASVDALAETLRAELGDEAVTDAIAEGHDMATAEAIAWLRRARGTRKRPAGGWESLTPTELRVVELAADGLSNPEIGKRMFISRGTAKVHLSHVYAKLGVRNRSELAALVARRQARQP
jgi:predicted ATPase/class 3 adenylate cyclase/DNA-binding CsgD family transcriptional regulator